MAGRAGVVVKMRGYGMDLAEQGEAFATSIGGQFQKRGFRTEVERGSGPSANTYTVKIYHPDYQQRSLSATGSARSHLFKLLDGGADPGSPEVVAAVQALNAARQQDRAARQAASSQAV